MKNVLEFLKQEAPSILLLLISLVPLLLCGWLLDISLIQWSTRVEEQEMALPILSRWVHTWFAGDRGLPQEIMLCLWMLMLLGFVASAMFANDQPTFRMRFMYSFAFVWILAISLVLAVLVACAAPFDLLLARLDDGQTPSIPLFRTILVAELILLVVVPVGIIFFKRRKRLGH